MYIQKSKHKKRQERYREQDTKSLQMKREKDFGGQRCSLQAQVGRLPEIRDLLVVPLNYLRMYHTCWYGCKSVTEA